MPQPLWSDPFLLSRATTLQTLLNAGKTLRLFRNSFLPNPDTLLSAFQECTFPGYAAISLDGLITGPTALVPGMFQLDSGVLVFQSTGGPSQTIYGWYIDDGTHMFSCQLLDVAVTICAGGAYAVQLRPLEISQSVLVQP